MSDTDYTPIATETVAVLRSLLHSSRVQIWQASVQMRDALLATPRGSDPLRLLTSGYKIFSQNDEDGIIEEIFRRIGTNGRTFLEFGVEGGVECNTLLLLEQGWSGAWIEANEKHHASILTNFASYLASGDLQVIQRFATPDNINDLIQNFDLAELDLLSIDIDGNDYWVWKAIEAARPRVVVIEYNAVHRPPREWIAALDLKRRYDGSHYHSASLTSLERLGESKGYALVGCNLNGCNAFFVRNDLLLDHSGGPLFCAPYTARNHFEPFRHPYLKFLTGRKVSTLRPVSDPL